MKTQLTKLNIETMDWSSYYIDSYHKIIDFLYELSLCSKEIYVHPDHLDEWYVKTKNIPHKRTHIRLDDYEIGTTKLNGIWYWRIWHD